MGCEAVSMESTDELRMLAIRQSLGEVVGANVLISSGLDALALGVDTQSLRELAGLGHREESEAQDLFRQVKDELALAATVPSDPFAARWELVRWWCRQVVGGDLAPEVGARLIWDLAWVELDFPPALQPIVARSANGRTGHPTGATSESTTSAALWPRWTACWLARGLPPREGGNPNCVPTAATAATGATLPDEPTATHPGYA